MPSRPILHGNPDLQNFVHQMERAKVIAANLKEISRATTDNATRTTRFAKLIRMLDEQAGQSAGDAAQLVAFLGQTRPR